MNQLPKLNTQGINILPGLQAGNQLRIGQQQNRLNALKLRDYEEDRGYEKKNREFERLKQRGELSGRGMDAAIKAGGSAENMKAVYKQVTGEDANFTIKGPDIKIETSMGILEGPADVIADYLDASASGLLEGPRKKGAAHAFMERKGVKITPSGAAFRGLSFTAPKAAKETPEQKKKRELETYRGKKKIDEEFDPSAKPDLTEAQARAKLFDLSKYRQKLSATGGLDPDMVANIEAAMPGAAKMFLGITDTKEIEAKLDEYETYLKSFVNKKKRLKYIPGKGFVE